MSSGPSSQPPSHQARGSAVGGIGPRNHILCMHSGLFRSRLRYQWSVMQIYRHSACRLDRRNHMPRSYLPGPYSVQYADVYLESVDFISISIAFYGLILFHGLTKDELAGHRPIAKF
ncbi:hypothetical protein EDB85DRAFT_2143779 [Lactarius pseudohatsudake]|nr:hypothetical protein EDB85DRAFT_2143779 [Lactarius pseudohatsudake]